MLKESYQIPLEAPMRVRTVWLPSVAQAPSAKRVRPSTSKMNSTKVQNPRRNS